MATPRKKWPQHAQNALDDALAMLREVESLAKQGRRNLEENRRQEAKVDFSDIERLVSKAISALILGREGKYE